MEEREREGRKKNKEKVREKYKQIKSKMTEKGEGQEQM